MRIDHKLRFTDETRKKIIDRFAEELLKANERYRDPRDEAEIFVLCLEGMAETSLSTSGKQKQRKERLEAFANALDRLLDASFKADDTSIAYAIWRGLQEVCSLPEFSDDDCTELAKHEGMPIIAAAHRLQHHHKSALSAFALGVRKSIPDLPPLDKCHTDELQTAKWIEEHLGRLNIPFSTSDTGLAGMSFLATMDLMGKDIQRAQYWLRQARDGDSWVKFIERMRLEQKNDAE